MCRKCDDLVMNFCLFVDFILLYKGVFLFLRIKNEDPFKPRVPCDGGCKEGSKPKSMKKMNLRIFALLSLAALTLAGCRSEAEPEMEGYGRLSLDCTVSQELLTRADLVPSGEEFSLTITGEEYEKSWAQLADFDSEEEWLPIGSYTISAEWGDLSEEGPEARCYRARQEEVPIARLRTTPVELTATLAHAVVEVECSEAFMGYFPSSSFTLTTAAGGEFTFTPAEALPLYISPGDFTLAATALKQDGSELELPTQHTSAVAQTHYAFSFDVSTAGAARLTIRLDDEPVEELLIETELNPEA